MPDEWLTALCKRCQRARSEHHPLAIPSEFNACGEFMEPNP